MTGITVNRVPVQVIRNEEEVRIVRATSEVRIVAAAAQGPPGPSGPTGPAGPTGPQGLPGDGEGSGPHDLDSHTDVDTTGVATGDGLALNGAGAWVPAQFAPAASVTAHAADTTSVHGIADTSALETATGSQAKVDAHVNDTTDAHDASAVSVTPAGSISSTDVQAALAELDSEKSGTGHNHSGTYEPAGTVATHESDTTSVHGIADTSALETTTGAQAKVDAHVNDTTDAHDASAVSVTPAGSISSTDVQAALAELDSEKSGTGHNHSGTYEPAGTVATHESDTTSVHGIADTSALETTTGSQAKVDAHVNDTTDAHDASAISVTPAGSISSTDVQAALAELDSEKSSTGHNHSGTYEPAGTVATHESDTTSVHGIADTSALYKSGGTDVAVADGGTGASTAAAALVNLGATTVVTWHRSGAATVTTGTARWYADRAYTIVEARASVNTAPTGASLIVDVNNGGTSIFTTQSRRPTIAASGFTDVSESPDGDTSLAAGDYMTVDIDQIGSTIAGSDLTVQVVLVPA